MPDFDYELIVIGGGPAGEKGAAQAAYSGTRRSSSKPIASWAAPASTGARSRAKRSASRPCSSPASAPGSSARE